MNGTPDSIPRDGNRNCNRNIYSLMRVTLENKFMVVSIQLLQPSACVLQANSFGTCYGIIDGQTRTIIFHVQFEPSLVLLGGDLDQATAGMRTDCIPDGIFHQRLKNEARYFEIKKARVNLNLHLETLPKAYLFDLQIAPKELKFLAQ